MTDAVTKGPNGRIKTSEGDELPWTQACAYISLAAFKLHDANSTEVRGKNFSTILVELVEEAFEEANSSDPDDITEDDFLAAFYRSHGLKATFTQRRKGSNGADLWSGSISPKTAAEMDVFFNQLSQGRPTVMSMSASGNASGHAQYLVKKDGNKQHIWWGRNNQTETSTLQNCQSITLWESDKASAPLREEDYRAGGVKR